MDDESSQAGKQLWHGFLRTCLPVVGTVASGAPTGKAEARQRRIAVFYAASRAPWLSCFKAKGCLRADSWAHVSRGSDQDLVMHGGGNTSVKAPFKDVLGNEIQALYVKGSGWDLATIEKEGFSPVRLETMLEVPIKLDTLSDLDMVNMQKLACLTTNAPAPSVEAMLHALIPYTFVDHSHSDAVCLLTNTPEAKKFVSEVYGPSALVVDYCIPGFILAKKVLSHSAVPPRTRSHLIFSEPVKGFMPTDPLTRACALMLLE